jgi:hypothetical protein
MPFNCDKHCVVLVSLSIVPFLNPTKFLICFIEETAFLERTVCDMVLNCIKKSNLKKNRKSERGEQVKIKPLRQLNSICSILYSIHRIEVFDFYTPKRNRKTRR